MIPYMVTDRDAQGIRVGHVKDLWNCHGSTTDPTDTVADENTVQRIGLFWRLFFNLQIIPKPFLQQIRLDLAMFLQIFIGAEASRMKGMPQGHP